MKYWIRLALQNNANTKNVKPRLGLRNSLRGHGNEESPEKAPNVTLVTHNEGDVKRLDIHVIKYAYGREYPDDHVHDFILEWLVPCIAPPVFQDAPQCSCGSYEAEGAESAYTSRGSRGCTQSVRT
jgi:hypothetical protein